MLENCLFFLASMFSIKKKKRKKYCYLRPNFSIIFRLLFTDYLAISQRTQKLCRICNKTKQNSRIISRIRRIREKTRSRGIRELLQLVGSFRRRKKRKRTNDGLANKSTTYCIETNRLRTIRAEQIRLKFRVLETHYPGMRISFDTNKTQTYLTASFLLVELTTSQ